MASTHANFESATAAYKDFCDRNGHTFQQPNEKFSKAIHDVVYLRVNEVSYVARYDARRNRLLA